MDIKEIKHKLFTDNIEEAFKMLKMGIGNKDKKHLNEIYKLESRLLYLRKNIRQGIMSNQDVQVERSIIVEKLLNVIEELDNSKLSINILEKSKRSKYLSSISLIVAFFTLFIAVIGMWADFSSTKLPFINSLNRDVWTGEWADESLKSFTKSELKRIFESIDSSFYTNQSIIVDYSNEEIVNFLVLRDEILLRNGETTYKGFLVLTEFNSNLLGYELEGTINNRKEITSLELCPLDSKIKISIPAKFLKP